jgi:hypothetical protein
MKYFYKTADLAQAKEILNKEIVSSASWTNQSLKIMWIFQKLSRLKEIKIKIKYAFFDSPNWSIIIWYGKKIFQQISKFVRIKRNVDSWNWFKNVMITSVVENQRKISKNLRLQRHMIIWKLWFVGIQNIKAISEKHWNGSLDIGIYQNQRKCEILRLVQRFLNQIRISFHWKWFKKSANS